MSQKNKKQIKVENESELVQPNSLPEISKEVQEKLDSINEKIKEIYDQNKKKMMEIENKYNEQMSAQFKKRSELLSKAKGFEGFWSNVLTQAMIDNFADSDQEVVEALVNMEVETKINVEKEETSKKIIFHFKDNSIFKNKSISKENVIDKNGDIKVNNTKIEFTNKQNNNNNSNNNNKDKKRKQDFSESSFILTWLQSTEPDVETLDEFARLYEDPFSVLLEENQNDQDDDDEDDEDDVDQDDDQDEEDDE